MPANAVEIRHIGTNTTSAFTVHRGLDGDPGTLITIPSPDKFMIGDEFAFGGEPAVPLRQELSWYLEHFLDYPLEPQISRAERLLEGLKKWGEIAFKALFGSQDLDGSLSDINTIQIRSNDPVVLSWPWEAIAHPKSGPIGLMWEVSRNFDVSPAVNAGTPLEKETLNILLVIARPFKNDVGYGNIARPLMDLIRSTSLQVNVEVLRPPTFEQLATQLRLRPRHYHVLHFDGHGGYGPLGVDHQGQKLTCGYLLFENGVGEEDAKSCFELASLLQNFHIPIVVLNACHSAASDEQGRDGLASVAASLLRAGVNSVVAMAYSIYESAAQMLVPAFYATLLTNGSVAYGLKVAREKLFLNKERICAWGHHQLNDWIVPVLYESAPTRLDFIQRNIVSQNPSPVASDSPNAIAPYAFVGRDLYFRTLERWLQSSTTTAFLHGLAGVGKTKIVREFVKWVDQTGGLERAAWIDPRRVDTFEDVESLIRLALNQQKPPVLVGDSQQENTLGKDRITLVVLDGLDGPGTLLSSQDYASWLDRLRTAHGSRLKLLITSRLLLGVEESQCLNLPVTGFDREERWRYSQLIVERNDLEMDGNSREFVQFLDALSGHPQAMEVVLPTLAQGSLSLRLQDSLSGKNSGIAAWQEAFMEGLMPMVSTYLSEMAQIVELIGLCSRFVIIARLRYMAMQANERLSYERLDACLRSLEQSGMIHNRAPLYEIHPLSFGALSNRNGEMSIATKVAFVEAMERDAAEMVSLPKSTQRTFGAVVRANCHHALSLAEALHKDEHAWSLCQSLGGWAYTPTILLKHWNSTGDWQLRRKLQTMPRE